MGLQGQVSDCSTESIFILAVSVVASFVSYLRSVTFMVLRYFNLSRFDPDEVDEGLLEAVVGSGLTGLIVLADQLNLNRIFSHAYGGDCDESAPSQCVVCLSKLKEGEQVRRLSCRHVFHKGCLDGWLDQLNFSCPICRSPLAPPPERVAFPERRVGHDLVAFFSLR